MHKDLLVKYHPGRGNNAREEFHFLNHLWLKVLSFRGKKELSKSSRTNRNLLFFILPSLSSFWLNVILTVLIGNKPFLGTPLPWLTQSLEFADSYSPAAAVAEFLYNKHPNIDCFLEEQYHILPLKLAGINVLFKYSIFRLTPK